MSLALGRKWSDEEIIWSHRSPNGGIINIFRRPPASSYRISIAPHLNRLSIVPHLDTPHLNRLLIVPHLDTPHLNRLSIVPHLDTPHLNRLSIVPHLNRLSIVPHLNRLSIVPHLDTPHLNRLSIVPHLNRLSILRLPDGCGTYFDHSDSHGSSQIMYLLLHFHWTDIHS
jgi:hypothetical protein